MAVRFDDSVYLFELKVAEQASPGAAMAQLRSRRYADKYRGTGAHPSGRGGVQQGCSQPDGVRGGGGAGVPGTGRPSAPAFRGIDRGHDSATRAPRRDLCSIFLENDREQRRAAEDDTQSSPGNARLSARNWSTTLSPGFLSFCMRACIRRTAAAGETIRSSPASTRAVTRPSSPMAIASRISTGIRTRPSEATVSDRGSTSRNVSGGAEAAHRWRVESDTSMTPVRNTAKRRGARTGIPRPGAPARW